MDHPSETSTFDSLGIFYNLCEDGFQAISDVCGFSNSANAQVDGGSTIENQINFTSADEWYRNASRIAFYADEIEVKQNCLCGSTSAGEDEHKENAKALLNMSLNAARIKHSYKNLKYDETQSINVITDIKIIRLIVGIPIGSE